MLDRNYCSKAVSHAAAVIMDDGGYNAMTIHNPSRLHLEAQLAKLADNIQHNTYMVFDLENYEPMSQSPPQTRVKNIRRSWTPRGGGTCMIFECESSHSAPSIYF